MRLFKNLKQHPRKFESTKKYSAVVIGGTGATGRQLISQLIKNKNCLSITSIGRRQVLNGRKNKKLKDIVIDSLFDMSSTANLWKNNDVFYNCIGTTRYLAGSAKYFKKIEVGISKEGAKMAFNARIPHVSLISANGANYQQWAKEWIHPLFYIKTIGEKEQTVLAEYVFNKVSIFRPGMLIRLMKKKSLKDIFFEKSKLGIRVDNLAAAMIRDSQSINLNNQKDDPIIYIGNKCINQSLKL